MNKSINFSLIWKNTLVEGTVYRVTGVRGQGEVRDQHENPI